MSIKKKMYHCLQEKNIAFTLLISVTTSPSRIVSSSSFCASYGNITLQYSLSERKNIHCDKLSLYTNCLFKGE